MAALTIEVPDRVAAVLGSLDKPLVADCTALASVIRWNLHQAGDRLAVIADAPDLGPGDQELRLVGQRLAVLAAACEAAG